MVDLPGVGANLQDHPAVPLVWRTRGTSDIRQLFVTEDAAGQWQLDDTGPLALAGAEACIFLALDNGTDPDTQVYAAPSSYWDDGFEYTDVPCCCALVSLVSPQSRGTVVLSSADPDDPPTIDPGFSGSVLTSAASWKGCA